MSNQVKSVDELAEKFAENGDNESGSFLSHQLKAIRNKSFKAGYQAGQLSSDEMIAKLENLIKDVDCLCYFDCADNCQKSKAKQALAELKVWKDKRG